MLQWLTSLSLLHVSGNWPDDHHNCYPLCCQKDQDGPVSGFGQKCSFKNFPSSFAVCGEPCDRTGKHQKAQFTNVYSFTEVHHTDDNDVGNICTKSLSFRKTFPRRLVYSILAIVLGAMVAACSDLAFDMEAYTFILLNDAFTAANNVYTKMKVGIEDLGKYGVLFYNALIIIIPTLLASASTGDLHEAVLFEDWVNVTFIICFLMSCFMGFVLMYSIVLCSYYNSALTTTVVGAIKNVAVAYIGIFVGGDYLFSWTNFLGLSICMSGGLVYSYLTFSNKSSGSNAKGAQELKIHITEDSAETCSAK
uniref:UDP-N-acetylglucosamine/UDP-glucose/GDP-mannose transporter-like isoform X2 n=1 Tax=Monopterus albus TaxID=43700 RepID=UPI0009B32B1A|nr:UDP-N-acetylglucosamine/UDP-glucose/GDP-mannose transporter-like isoform X2 [Monopterus albus]